MTRVILVPYDQLSRDRGAMRDAVPGRDEILMIESERMLRSRTWHAQRLHLLLSAAVHHARDLREQGFTVHEGRAASVGQGVDAFRREHPNAHVVATEPRSRPLRTTLAGRDVDLVPDDSFLTPRDETLRRWNGRLPVMESFYREQRRRLGVLMDGSQPVGGQWNFDADNRLPPPKTAHPWPEPLRRELDEIDHRVWRDIVDRGLPVTGQAPDGTWATTRAGALRQLEHFLQTGLAGFGPYEDAMPTDTWSAYHSLLSPYLNCGLLDPDEVVSAALARYAVGDVPLSSIEGFVRQVIGWREYVNLVYWATGEEYAQANGFTADQPLPPAFDDPARTEMACVRSVASDVHERAWTHHIPRLIVLANLSLLAGVRPDSLLDWMRRMFVDAADWVMVPNVIGMGVHADGGRMMTKPYAAGGAYISRMSRHCRACPFDPKKRTGDDACPFTTLYWDFIDRNLQTLATNQRMSQPVAGLRRLSDLDEVRLRAADVRARLSTGDL